LRKETFCHAGERKSPRVTEEGPETPPEASSETFASASRSSSSSELSSAKAQKRDPPAARRSGRGERGERGRGGNAGARAGEGIASATPQEGNEGEPTVIFLLAQKSRHEDLGHWATAIADEMTIFFNWILIVWGKSFFVDPLEKKSFFVDEGKQRGYSYKKQQQSVAGVLRK
jgi:hypothetical protein